MPPVVIGLGIGAISSVASAAIQSRAAGRAADTQSAAADKVLELQREVYQQQREDLAPYRQVGGQAVNTLGGLMGFSPTNAMGRPPEKTPAPGDIQPGQTRNVTFSSLVKPTPTGPAQTPTLGTLMNSPQAQAQQQTQSSFRRMRAPDGRTVNVPEPLVEQAMANGGVPV